MEAIIRDLKPVKDVKVAGVLRANPNPQRVRAAGAPQVKRE